jgi:hypothetical protein
MFKAIQRSGARLLGLGESSPSVPVFDGAYTPNNILEGASVLFAQAGLEDIAVAGDGSLVAACGKDLIRIDAKGGSSQIASFNDPLQAIAVLPDGGIAVAVSGRLEFEGGAMHGRRLPAFEARPLHGVNALQVSAQGKLLVSEGSMRRPYEQWRHDLLEHGRTGRVLEVDLANNATRALTSNLAYCFGVGSNAGSILAAESWAHRLVRLDGKRVTPALDALPGYPARFSSTADGGFWLTLFAGRTQLFEFILREDDFREEMMRTVAPEYWLAPSLLAGQDFLEPQQTAGVMQMGVIKPWAPPRSYGMVVRLNAELQPMYSLHSRVGGRNHGVVAAVEQGDDLFILSKGAGRILKLSISAVTSDLNNGSKA